MLAFVETQKVDGLMSKKTYKFKQKNLVSCVGIPFRTLVWNYICWFLAGKPKMKKREIK